MALFNTKFFHTIQTFSPTELKSFELWLKSPWANSNKNLIRLLEKVAKHHPDFDNPKLTKAKLFKQILPNGKYSDRRMNNLLSEGYLAAERFMIFNNLSNNQNLQKDLLSQELQNRHLEDWFFRDINKEVVRLEAKTVKDWEDHLDLLRLNRRIYHHPNQNPRMLSGKQTIVKMGEQLDLVYLLEKAAIINEKIFRNRILKNENHEVDKELKIWLVASEELEHLAIELYRMRFNYAEETMLEQYFELRAVFLERYEELNEKEQKVHLMSLLNDTTLFIRKNLIDIRESLPLYKLGLSTKILLYRDKLVFNYFVIIVSASNYDKDFTFSDYFIKSYSQKLDKNFQKDGQTWAIAHTAYYKGNFTFCQDTLLDYNFKNIYFQLISKLLLTQVYFDLFLRDSTYQFYLFNYFDSFEKWITREKFRSQLVKKSYLRFVQICRTLAKSHNELAFNKEKIEKLIENENNLQAAKWIKNKILEIIQLKHGGRPIKDDLI